MKLCLKCKVNGKVALDKRIEISQGPKIFILLPDEQGLLSSIQIVVKGLDPNKFHSRMEPGNGQVAAKLTIKGDREFYKELIRDFQELESILSFETSGCLKSIDWDEPEREWIPETEDEKSKVNVYKIHFKKEYADSTSSIDEETFSAIIQTKHRYASLILPKAFFREGINEFRQRRYINAFYNFYYVLEDLYGQGKTRNKDIYQAFKGSSEFRSFTEWVIKNHINTDKRHQSNILKLCTEEKVRYDRDGLIELLQKVRGNLHHFSSKSSKHLGSPFNHEDFESIAFFTMGLAVRAILQKILQINQQIGASEQ